MDGAELAARFSYITNTLRFCGPEQASEQFLQYIKEKGNSEDVRDSVKKFEGLYPYLSAIAGKTNLDLLDFGVVEAYWIGNSLLDTFDKEDLAEIIDALTKRGLPASIGKSLIDGLPAGFVPHHSFNVMYVGVGKTTGSVETTTQNMDNCIINWGKVIEIRGSEIIVETQSLKSEGGIYRFTDQEHKTAVFLPELMPGLKKGDFVALHWGFAAMVLDEAQLANLKKYTSHTIGIMNGLAAN